MNKKTTPHGLGRGLGALLGDIDEALPAAKAAGAENAVTEVSLNDIDINRDQPRKDFDEESLKELAESIKSVGVIQPIVLKRMATGIP